MLLTVCTQSRTKRESNMYRDMHANTAPLLPHKLAIRDMEFPAFLPRSNTGLQLRLVSDLHDAQSLLRSVYGFVLPLDALRP